jgi:hypothetical protein
LNYCEHRVIFKKIGLDYNLATSKKYKLMRQYNGEIFLIVMANAFKSKYSGRCALRNCGNLFEEGETKIIGCKRWLGREFEENTKWICNSHMKNFT